MSWTESPSMDSIIRWALDCLRWMSPLYRYSLGLRKYIAMLLPNSGLNTVSRV